MSDDQVVAGEPDDSQGDASDQAQRLQSVDEQNAIDEALGRTPADEEHQVIDPEYLATLTESDDD
jgi:hypothetical protein